MRSFWSVILFLAVAFLVSGSSLTAGPVLNVLEPVYDFGCVGIDYDVYHEFLIANDGDEPFKIDSLYPTCDCTTIRLLDSLVNPGDTISFRLKFNTKDYYGPTSRTVRLLTSIPGDTTRQIKYNSIVGQWPYGLKPDPISLFFLPGHKSIEVKLLNPVLESLEIDQISFFDELVKVSPSSQKVGKGGKIVFEIEPLDSLPRGTHHTNVSITFKTPEENPSVKITLPIKIVKY